MIESRKDFQTDKCPLEITPRNKDGTAGRIGKEYGVNGRTIRRDAEFAKGIDMAEKTAPGIRDAILSGEVKVSKETVAQLPSMPKDDKVSYHSVDCFW